MELFKYSIIDPRGGIELFRSRYNVWQDAKNKQSIYQYHDITLEPDEIIRNLFPKHESSIPKLKQNLVQLQNHINNFFERLDDKQYPSKTNPYLSAYRLDSKSSLLLYILCKLIKPEKVVETGVAYGLSSSYILQALDENDYGKLFSIDYVFRPWESKQMIGAIIPTHLRKRWNFVYGIASQKLKSLLDSLGTIDIFFHDSQHTYRNMKYEFDTVWPFLKKGGFILSDDISGNNAFYEFYSKRNLKPIILSQDRKNGSFLGIIQKL